MGRATPPIPAEGLKIKFVAAVSTVRKWSSNSHTAPGRGRKHVCGSLRQPSSNSHARAKVQCGVAEPEYLTEGEVEELMDAGKAHRWGQRDATMIPRA